MPAHPDSVSWPSLDTGDRGLAALPRGQFLVRTSSTSSYLLDFDAGTATRYPGANPGEDWNVSALRADGEERAMLSVVCAVGQPMVLLLALGETSAPTLRTTTPVVSIERVDVGHDPGGPAGLEAACTFGSMTNAPTPHAGHTACRQCGHDLDPHLMLLVVQDPPAGIMVCDQPGCACGSTWRLSNSGPSTPEEIEHTRQLVRDELVARGVPLPRFLQ